MYMLFFLHNYISIYFLLYKYISLYFFQSQNINASIGWKIFKFVEISLTMYHHWRLKLKIIKKPKLFLHCRNHFLEILITSSSSWFILKWAGLVCWGQYLVEVTPIELFQGVLDEVSGTLVTYKCEIYVVGCLIKSSIEDWMMFVQWNEVFITH